MAEAATDLAVKILDECAERIRANMARKYRTAKGERWVNASGRSAAAFKVEVSDGGNVIRLVYSGDDVAPLDSIQYGHDEAPGREALKKWYKEKFDKELGDGRARDMIRKIAEEGTERYSEPQEWIITPEVEAAVDALVDQLPAAAGAQVRDMLFQG